MKLLVIAVCSLLSSLAHAQFTPLCDDGMGGSKPCLGTLHPNLLPIVPTSRGGTGAVGALPDTVFFGIGGTTIGFRKLTKTAISGMSVDLTTSPGPLIEVRKAVGAWPQLVGIFPGRVGTFNRLYAGENGFWFTLNASTGNGTDFDKDTTANFSSVFELRADGVRIMSDGNAGLSRYAATSARFGMRLNGGLWLTSSAPQFAVAGGTVCGGQPGDTYQFPVQWPVPYETVPTAAPSSDIVSSGTNVASVSDVSRYGAVLNVRNVNLTGARCVTWVGYVTARN